ncbi:stealth family protein [Planosporangium sp. 12N6]|uniref:stealth family protein n=1 Tax=Planosporangium spinosum TaxID=3402278 RepID=UPI003CF1B553
MAEQRAERRTGMVARPPARSLVLRVYGNVVPLNVRLKVREQLSPELRAHLARRLTQGGRVARSRDRMAARIQRLQYREAFAGADRMAVRYDGHTYIGLVHPAPTPTVARLHTLEFVLRTLHNAGVTAFRVRGYHDTGSVVGVPAEQRAHAVAALAAASVATPGYVGSVNGEPRPAATLAVWQRLRGHAVLRFTQFVVDPAGRLVLGREHGCDLEFWARQDGQLVAPRPNRVADTVPADEPLVLAEDAVFMRTPLPGAAVKHPTHSAFLGDLLDDITFPIDVVYTWVDGADPAWRARRDRALGEHAAALNEQAANESRYTSRDELRYSMRSLFQYAPWVRRIWLVTDDQVPPWLDTAHHQITVVSHRELFAGRGLLPTFNSHAIETQLHRIEGLSEHFLYFNDDVMLGRPVQPQAFFHANGLSKLFPSTAKIDPSEPSVLDAPVTAAGKNNRRLIHAGFARRVTYKMKHCPHPLRRSVLEELSGRYAEELENTARHQFRHPDDVSLPSSLYHYYAHLTGRAVVGDLRYMYTNIADPDTAHRLRLTLARRDYDVMCLNDTDSDPAKMRQLHEVLEEFLDAYYPVAAPWERSR